MAALSKPTAAKGRGAIGATMPKTTSCPAAQEVVLPKTKPLAALVEEAVSYTHLTLPTICSV
eukprot:8034081-Alexandrium_andersonii.AAC.1